MKYIVKNTAIRHNGKYYEIGETVTFTSVPASLVNNLLLMDSPLVTSVTNAASSLPSNSEQILSAAHKEKETVSDEVVSTVSPKVLTTDSDATAFEKKNEKNISKKISKKKK